MSSSLPPTPTTTETPFFQGPGDVVPPSQTPDSQSSLGKMVLEWLFLVLALLLAAVIIFYRLYRLRRANQSASRFFSWPQSQSRSRSYSTNYTRPIPRTTGLPLIPNTNAHSTNGSLAYPYYAYPHLSPLPIAHTHSYSRRTRAADIGAGGRRLGGGGDHDGGLDDKDALPAYDHQGGPPKYMELELQGGRTRFMGMGVVHSQPDVDQHDAEGGTEREMRENDESFNPPPSHEEQESTLPARPPSTTAPRPLAD